MNRSRDVGNFPTASYGSAPVNILACRTEFPSGPILLSASGAAFAAVVLGQTANAFACRSTTQWPGAIGWFSNRLLVIGICVELVIMTVLFAPSLAGTLNQALPSAPGWAVAILAGPAVLAADMLYKAARRRSRG